MNVRVAWCVRLARRPHATAAAAAATGASLVERLAADQAEAMRAKDAFRLQVVRSVRSRLT